MDPHTLDTSFAIMTRRFDLVDGRHVDIFIGKPEFPANVYPTCKFLICGLGDDKIREAKGVDGLDALVAALEAVRILLYTSQEYKAGKLTWMGERDLSIPLLPTT